MDIQRPGLVIQKIAKVFFVIELIGAVISMIVLSNSLGIGSFLIGLGTILAAFMSYVFIYGIGRIIDNTDILVAALAEKELDKDTDRKPESSNSSRSDNKQSGNSESQDEYVDLYCPQCNEKLSYSRSQIVSGKLNCPYCGESFDYSKD